jgi:hypothetical protein
MNNETIKQIEFGKIIDGGNFFLSPPETPADFRAVYTKVISKKDQNGAWANAKNIYGLTTFVQYDKRVWIKL